MHARRGQRLPGQAVSARQRQPRTHRHPQAYGAELELTDPLEGSDGALRRCANAPRRAGNLLLRRPDNNPANWQAHYNTTRRIWEQTQGAVTHFIAGWAPAARSWAPDAAEGLQRRRGIVALQPDSAFHGLEGLSTWRRPSSRASTTPSSRIVSDGQHRGDLRNGAPSRPWEGYLVGISAAAAMVVSLALAEELADAGRAVWS